MKEKKGLAIAGMALGISSVLVSCCGWLSIALAIIGLSLSVASILMHQNKPFAITGIITSGFAILISVIVLITGVTAGMMDSINSSSETTEETEYMTEEETTEETTESTEISEEDFKAQAMEVSYEDIYRNPETYRDQIIKITVNVQEYDTQLFGLNSVYYCTMDGNDLLVSDRRTIEEPTIAPGDTVTIYGKGNGMATLTEEQKDEFGFTTDSTKSLIPDVSMIYVELN